MQITDLQNKLRSMEIARDAYDKAKEISNKLHATYKGLETEVITIMDENELSKFTVDDVGSFTRVDKLVYRTPKTPEDKNLFFECLTNHYGEEALTDFVSINHMTMNRICNEMAAEGVLDISGLEEPTMVSSLRRKK